MREDTSGSLSLPALIIRQGNDQQVFVFAVDGKRIEEFAVVWRVSRDDAGSLDGYQRAEVGRHVDDIREYLERSGAILPNALVIAFDERTTLRELDHTHGWVTIPRGRDPRASGWVVDGQQRIAALREAAVENFPVFVVGFIAPQVASQREQFIRINNTKPLPRGLLYELMPGTPGGLPGPFEVRREATTLASQLAHDPRSPLAGVVKTMTTPGGRMSLTSLIKAVGHSLSDGLLYRIGLTVAPCATAQLEALFNYWGAVRDVWPDAWRMRPRDSRLMHGAGVVSLGFLMDATSDNSPDLIPTTRHFSGELMRVQDECCWTDGFWDFGGGRRRRWDEIQNTPQDADILSNLLLRKYLVLRRGGSP